jgi:hypothetical protein
MYVRPQGLPHNVEASSSDTLSEDQFVLVALVHQKLVDHNTLSELRAKHRRLVAAQIVCFPLKPKQEVDTAMMFFHLRQQARSAQRHRNVVPAVTLLVLPSHKWY